MNRCTRVLQRISGADIYCGRLSKPISEPSYAKLFSTVLFVIQNQMIGTFYVEPFISPKLPKDPLET